MAEIQRPLSGLAAASSRDNRTPSSSGSKDQRAVRSAEALRQAMLRLLTQKAFEEITIRDICAGAGIHYATFFRHHDTKASLLGEIARDQIREINNLTLAIRDAANYQSGFRTLCQYVADHRMLWSILLNGGAAATMREEWLHQSQIVAAREAPVNSWLPMDLGTICASALIAETMAWWLAQTEDAYSVEVVAGILNRMLTASIIHPD